MESRLLSDPNTLWQVDLFIFDFDMREMTGTQIASVLDQFSKELKAIPFFNFSGRPREDVLTSIAETTKYNKAFAKNFWGDIEKSKSVAELIKRIDEVLL